MSDKPVYESHGSYDFSNNVNSRSSQDGIARPVRPVNNVNRVPQNRVSAKEAYARSNGQPQQGPIRRPVRSAYPINNNPKQLRGVNNSRVAGKAYKDKKGKIHKFIKNTAIGFLIALTLATGIHFGVKAINDHIEYTENRDKIVDAVVYNADDGYWEAMMSEDDFREYLETKIDDVAKKEPNMQDFIRDTDDIGEGAIPYMITGEDLRENLSNEDILEALAKYRPYVSKDVEKGKMPKDMSQIISISSAMSDICTTEENKADLVALFDAIIGQNSVNNSKAALEYEIELNEEAKERVIYNTPEELKEKIYVNDNFFNYLERGNSGLYLGTYRNFHNDRIRFINDILQNSYNEALKEVLDKYSDAPSMSTLNEYLNINPKNGIDMAGKFANVESFKEYIEYRNDFYRDILEKQADPDKAISEWDMESSSYQNRIDNQKKVEEIDIVAYVNSLIEILEENKEKAANFEQAKSQYERVKKELEGIRDIKDHSDCDSRGR